MEENKLQNKPESSMSRRETIEYEEARRKARARKRWYKAWLYVRPFFILAISVAACVFVVNKGVGYVRSNYIDPVDIKDATPIEITVPSGYGASGIAKLLYEAGGDDAPGLINSKAVFKVYVDFTGKASKLKAGTYYLSRNLDIEQIVDTICKGNPPRVTVRFTITEGMTVADIADKLVELGILKDKATFLELCVDAIDFDYFFLTPFRETGLLYPRDYLLEGYLFPDTYEVYTDSSESFIINRMLKGFSTSFNDECIERAKELGMSIDDIVVLASMIEKEAKIENDFAKVSAVFHNRLDENMTLGSDVTLAYALKTNKMSFTAKELQNPSHYNTHLYEGLPAGPICNPGMKAIKAALWPNETYISEKYLYFCLTTPETGELVYAKTLEDHNKNVEKYREFWK